MRLGQHVTANDAVGPLPRSFRNDDNLVTTQTDARGNPTFYEYDDRGNVTSIRDMSGTAAGLNYLGGNLPVGDNPIFVLSVDLNGDGADDLVTTNESHDVSILMNSGTGSFSPEQRIAVGQSPQSVAFGDLNGDAIGDLVVASSSTPVLTFLAGNW